MEGEIDLLLGKIKNKNKITNNLLENFNKPQNPTYNESNKTSSSSEKVLISHDNDTTIDPQEAVKKKQSTDNRSNKSGLSKRDNWKRSQDNAIAIVHLENSTSAESVDYMFLSCQVPVSEWIYTLHLPECQLLARSRRRISSLSDCNRTRTHNHLVHKRTLNELAKLAK